MRLRLAVVSMLVSALAGSAASEALAHGGQYRGPPGEVPPDSREPEDPPPPETSPGTPTPPDPGGGTPTPGDPGPGTPTPPDGPGTPDPSGPGGGSPGTPPPGPGATRTGKSAAKSLTFESWIFWWNYNKDEILDLRRRLRSDRANSGDGLGLSGLAEGSANAAEEQDPTAREMTELVVPVLVAYARHSKIHPDIQASGVLGLARIGRAEQIPLLMEMASNRGKRYDAIVEETAALSLGVMQERTPEVRKFLCGVAADGEARVRTRCFAMFALGLLGEPDAAAGSQAEALGTLRSIVLDAGEQDRDVVASALVGIGLLGDRAAIPDLLQWLDERKAGTRRLADLHLSFAAAALGRIGQPGLSGPGSDEVVRGLREQLLRKNRLTRWSSVIALGQVAPQADERVQGECVHLLSQVVRSEGKTMADSQTVNFALASLGRIAGSPSCPKGARDRAVATLGAAFEDARSQTVRSFAALAMGIAGMGRPQEERVPLADPIRNALAKIETTGDVERRGALVLSLGLLGDMRSARLLNDILADRKADGRLRGAAAVALGLIGDGSAVEPVRAALKERDDPKLRLDAAVGAGLLRDHRAVGILVEILRDPKSSQIVLGSATQALGRIGDRSAVEPLAKILQEEKSPYPDLTRALAAVALGQIGDRSDLPVLSRLSRDVNYRAYFDAMGEVLSIL